MPLDYPNAVTVELVQSLHGQPLMNVLKFQNNVPFVLDDLVVLAETVRFWIESDLAPVLSVDWTADFLIVTSIDLGNPIMYVHTEDMPIAGSVGAAASPVNVAALNRLFTGFIGSGRKGRVYTSGIAENEVTGNTILALTVTELQAAWNALISQMALTSWTWIVASGMNQPGPGTGITSPVLGVTTDHRVHDMGRRLDNISI